MVEKTYKIVKVELSIWKLLTKTKLANNDKTISDTIKRLINPKKKD